MMRGIYQAGQKILAASASLLRTLQENWRQARGRSAVAPHVQRPARRKPGVYSVHGNPHEHYKIVAHAARQILPDLYADLMHALGERVLLVVGETPDMEPSRQMLSFSPQWESAQLRSVLFDYGDVIAGHDGLALMAQNTDKSGNLILTAEKLICMQVCCPQRFMHTLAAHGLQRVPACDHAPRPPAGAGLNAVDEWRLLEFKQQLELTSITFCPRREWRH